MGFIYCKYLTLLNKNIKAIINIDMNDRIFNEKIKYTFEEAKATQ